VKLTRKRSAQIHGIFRKIVETFGQSKHYNWLPSLVLYVDESASWNGMWLYGDFDFEDKCITINVASHRTLRQLVSTILHEYKHYLQSPTWYTRHEAAYRYAEHPYEHEADKFAAEHVGQFVSTKR